MDQTERIKNEIRTAYQARAEGNEGKARVCARRAAGWAIREKLNIEGTDLNTPSAFDYIKYLYQSGNNSPRITIILEHLQQKVVKDSEEQDSYWPLPEVDLLAEACWLCEELLGIQLDLEK